MTAKVDGTNINPEINLKKSDPGKKGSIKKIMEVQFFFKISATGTLPSQTLRR